MKKASPKRRGPFSLSLGGRLDNVPDSKIGTLDQVYEAPGLHLAVICSGVAVRRMAHPMSAHPQTPLYDALAELHLALAHLLGHLTPLPSGLIKNAARRSRPVAVLIADDPPGLLSLGPAGWLYVPLLAEWRPTVVIILGVVAAQDQYARAAIATERYGRALIVETSSAATPLWRAQVNMGQSQWVLH